MFVLKKEDRISERFTNGIYFIRTQTDKLEDYLKIINNCLHSGYSPFKIVIVSSLEENRNFCIYIEKQFNIPCFFLLNEEYINLIVNFYSEKPRVFIGITGSSGKSSIAISLFNILKNICDKKVFIASSAGLGSEILMENSLSSLPFADLYYYLNLYKDCEYAILEVTSHGLHQQRILGITLDIGVITNIQEDHLDYHKTPQEYLRCKLEIMKQIKKNGFLFIPKDFLQSPYFNENLKKMFEEYSKNIHIIEIPNDINFADFNIYENLNINTCVNILKNLELRMKPLTTEDWQNVFPTGRFVEMQNTKNKSIIIMDGAHNPDQINNIIDIYQNKFPEKKVIIVYGIAGHRLETDMKNPRIIDQKLREKDLYFIVDDQPQNINSDFICKHIFDQCVKKSQIINSGNRFSAIEKVCNEDNACVLILGKTTETKNIIEFQYDLHNWEEFFTKKLSYFKFISEIKLNSSLLHLSKSIYKKIEKMNFEMTSNLNFVNNKKKNSILLFISKKNDSISFVLNYNEIDFISNLINS